MRSAKRQRRPPAPPDRRRRRWPPGSLSARLGGSTARESPAVCRFDGIFEFEVVRAVAALSRYLPQLLQQQRLGDDHSLQLAQVEAFVGGVHLRALIARPPDDELGIRGQLL